MYLEFYLLIVDTDFYTQVYLYNSLKNFAFYFSIKVHYVMVLIRHLNKAFGIKERTITNVIGVTIL